MNFPAKSVHRPYGDRDLALTKMLGDSYDNALAEAIIGPIQDRGLHRRGPWYDVDTVEYATLVWGDWFNNRRLLEPIGYVRRRCTIVFTRVRPWRHDSRQRVSGEPGAVHDGAPVRAGSATTARPRNGQVISARPLREHLEVGGAARALVHVAMAATTPAIVARDTLEPPLGGRH